MDWIHSIHLANGVRLATLLIGFVASGLMARFYQTRSLPRRMRWLPTTAFFLMMFYIADNTAENWDRDWDWNQTPIAFAAFTITIITLIPYLKWGRNPPNKP